MNNFLNEDIHLNDLLNDIENLNHELVESSDEINAITNDKDLMSLIINEKLYLDFINTKLYLLFSWYLINKESSNVINDIILEMRNKGFIEESAKLFIKEENFFDSYKSLSISLILIDKLS